MSQTLAEQVNLELQSIESELKEKDEKWKIADQAAEDAREDYQQKEDYANQIWKEKRILEKRKEEMKNYLK
jgi:hypothetical protein